MLLMTSTTGVLVLALTNEDFENLQAGHSLKAEGVNMDKVQTVVMTWAPTAEAVIAQIRAGEIPLSADAADAYQEGAVGELGEPMEVEDGE